MLRGCSQWGSPAEPEIFSQIIICLFCMRIYCIYRPSCMWTQLSGEYIINFISLLIISISEAKSHKWWLSKMFAQEATMRVEHFLSEYPSPAFINVFSPHRKLTRCLVESFGERRVSSYIHGGNYLKVSKLSTYMRTPNFFKKSHVWDWPKISSCQAEIVRKKGKSLLNDPLFNKVPSHL